MDFPLSIGHRKQCCVTCVSDWVNTEIKNLFDVSYCWPLLGGESWI